MTSEKLKLPADLLSQMVFTYENSGQGVEKLKYRLSKFMNEELHKKKKLKGTRGPREAIAETISTSSPREVSFRTILSLEAYQQAKLFEEWFFELAQGVEGWDVIHNPSKEIRDKGFDLIIWNSLPDTEVAALGTPLPVEIKATRSIQMEFINELASKSQLQSFKGVLLATTARATRSNRKTIREIFERQNFLFILLDRDDLLTVTSPRAVFITIDSLLLRRKADSRNA